MSEYTLVKKENLTEIANKLRSKGITGTLVFPEGFINAIEQLVPGLEILTLSFSSGETVVDINGTRYDDYVLVSPYRSAVWSFTPTINSSTAKVELSWDNTIGEIDENTDTPYDYKFNIINGQSTIVGTQIVPISGASGTLTLNFTNLSLEPETEYYIHAISNHGTVFAYRAFNKYNNTIELTS